MNKNLVIFLAASAAILLVWTKFFAPPPAARRAPAAGVTAAPTQSVAVAAQRPQPARAESVPRRTATALPRDIVIENADLAMTVSTEGARVRSIRMKKHLDRAQRVDVLPAWSDFGSFEIGSEDAELTAELKTSVWDARDEGLEHSFRTVTSGGVVVEKRFRLPTSGYLWELEVYVTAPKNGLLERGFRVGLGSQLSRSAQKRGELLEVVAYLDRKEVRALPGEPILGCVTGSKATDVTGAIEGVAAAAGGQPRVVWAGLKSKYFAAVVLPDFGSQAVGFHQVVSEGTLGSERVRTVAGRSVVEVRASSEIRVPGGSTARIPMRVYTGPLQIETLQAHGEKLEKVVDLGFFNAIGRGMMWILKRLHSFTSNWGIAIMLLTVLVRGVLWYPTHRSMVSMRGMYKIQPHMQAMQQKYKGDPKRLQQEMARVYREHGISPLLPVMGCLPIVMQMPIFIALYATLSSAFDLRGTPFVWLPDLSQQDPFYVVPLLIGASMWVQQKLSMSPTMDPTQAKMMLWMMPIVMTFMFLTLPAGIGVYWVVSNLVSIAQQLFVNKAAPIPASVVPATK